MGGSACFGLIVSLTLTDCSADGLTEFLSDNGPTEFSMSDYRWSPLIIIFHKTQVFSMANSTSDFSSALRSVMTLALLVKTSRKQKLSTLKSKVNSSKKRLIQ